MASTITIAAASSLSSVLPLLVEKFHHEIGNAVTIRTTFGASGTIARQILAGAPIDIFLSAGTKETDQLKAAPSFAGTSSTKIFAQNRLVLAQAKTAKALHSFADLSRLSANFRIAMGKPETVPAGRYAKETLVKRGLWDKFNQSRSLVFTGTVRQASDAAASGNVQAAFIFATDVRANPNLRASFAAVPGKDHEPIQYVAVVCPSRNSVDSARFIQFLTGRSGQQVLQNAGFLAP